MARTNSGALQEYLEGRTVSHVEETKHAVIVTFTDGAQARFGRYQQFQGYVVRENDGRRESDYPESRKAN